MSYNHHTHSALRLTPSNSPFLQNKSPRSPTRRTQEEPGLQLRKVVGTTTSSSSGFDALPSSHAFAYTAGAAAVVATVSKKDLTITQRFFRARPVAATGSSEVASTWAASPTPLQPKHRALGTLRESSVGSPLSLSINGRDWSDSPTGKSSTAKDRVKAATSVALSPNGKWLAIGETGYKPRILIFSLAEGSSETPVASICEHMYGVHCLRFSPDSRYLASLGTVNDGFLYVWTINDRTGVAELFASNKLTTLINCIAWMGKSLLTVGLRFVKVWRPDDAQSQDTKIADSASNLLTPRQRDSSRLSDFGRSVFTPKHKTLHGKNSLLNDLLECNFVTVLALSSTKAILCADTGEICVLDDVGKTQNMTLAGTVDFAITAARLQDGQMLTVLGPGDRSKCVPIDNIAVSLGFPKSSIRQIASPVRAPDTEDAVVATAELDGVLVELTASRSVTISCAQPQEGNMKTTQLPAHKDAIAGVRTLSSSAIPTAKYLTYSGDGNVNFWDLEGNLASSLFIPALSHLDAPVNELKVVVPSSDGQYLIAGDKLGVLMLFDISTGVCIRRLRAHSAEIMDAATAVVQGTEIVATAGRDRVVQLFIRRDTEFELVQTLDEHAGAVVGLLIDTIGHRLISYSSDRTVVIREALFQESHPSRPIAFTIARTIVLKSSPTAITLSSDDHLFVAAVDRCISKYNLVDGQCAQTFKCADNEGGEAVVMSQMLHLPSLYGMSCIAGVSSADKSVRLYTEHGSLLARDWGHTEGITDLAILSDDHEERISLITVAADSTMFVWNTQLDKSSRGSISNALSEYADPLTDARLGAPLRRVISQSELARFTRKKSSADNSKTSSPTNISTPTQPQPSSPQRLRKKHSRSSVAQPPRLEPSAQFSQRTNARLRSPSPPSPRSFNKKRESMRRRSMATLRSKSSDNVPSSAPTLPPINSSGFGSLSSSTESVCRTLRAYRKRLATVASDNGPIKGLRELDEELRLTVRLVNEHLQGKALDEASVSIFLEQASERIVEMLDGRLKERLTSGAHRTGSDGSYSMTRSDGSHDMMSSIHLAPPTPLLLEAFQDTGSDSEALAGAMEATSIR